MMLVSKAIHLALLAAAMLWSSRSDASALTFKLCGRNLGETMSTVCHQYNSPSWDVPTVVEQPAAAVRRKRHLGIADECCINGCSYHQLLQYCAVSVNSESPMDAMDSHMIADRSAEQEASVSPAVIGGDLGRREAVVKSVARAAPVVGTVSPLLTWGRTLYTDVPPANRDRYAYVAVYA